MEQCICPKCGQSHNKQHRAIIVIGIAAHDIPSTMFNRNHPEEVFEPPTIKVQPLPPMIPMMDHPVYYEEHKQRKSRTNKRKFNGF